MIVLDCNKAYDRIRYVQRISIGFFLETASKDYTSRILIRAAYLHQPLSASYIFDSASKDYVSRILIRAGICSKQHKEDGEEKKRQSQ